MSAVSAAPGGHVRMHGRTLVRAFGVIGAVLAALVTWAIAVPFLGTDLLIRFGTGSPQTVQIEYVIGASLVGSLGGWALVALLERRTKHVRALWTTLAVVVLLLSLTLPLTAGATISAKVVLATMHIAVAAVLLPVLGLTSGLRDRRSTAATDIATTRR